MSEIVSERWKPRTSGAGGRMRKCPICDKTAKVEKESRYGEMFCRKSEKYYVRCGCEVIHLRGKNKPDLEASWNRWVGMMRK